MSAGLRTRLVRVVNALETALFSEDEQRLDEAERVFEEMERWLIEHPVGCTKPIW